MPAYVIGNISIKDAARWAEYRDKLPATLAPWSAELVFRAKRNAVFSGAHRHADVVVIRFPDAVAASNWFNSAAYQAIVALRDQAADVDLVSYEADS